MNSIMGPDFNEKVAEKWNLWVREQYTVYCSPWKSQPLRLLFMKQYMNSNRIPWNEYPKKKKKRRRRRRRGKRKTCKHWNATRIQTSPKSITNATLLLTTTICHINKYKKFCQILFVYKISKKKKKNFRSSCSLVVILHLKQDN